VLSDEKIQKPKFSQVRFFFSQDMATAKQKTDVVWLRCSSALAWHKQLSLWLQSPAPHTKKYCI
jgi:hypothetical protein